MSIHKEKIPDSDECVNCGNKIIYDRYSGLNLWIKGQLIVASIDEIKLLLDFRPLVCPLCTGREYQVYNCQQSI